MSNFRFLTSKGIYTAFVGPSYVQHQLRQRAVDTQTSLRQVMLAALQTVGVYVSPDDLSADDRPVRIATRGSQVAFPVPMYVMIQVRALAVRQKWTLRYLMLTAIRAIGIRIEPNDLVPDRRQGRPSGSRGHYAGRPRVKGGSLRFPRTSPSSDDASPG